MPYKDYLKTDHWKKIRTELYARPRGKYCAVCGSTESLNIHHKSYKSRSGNNVLFREHFGQLVVLCQRCHHMYHELNGNKRMRRKDMFKLRRLLTDSA